MSDLDLTIRLDDNNYTVETGETVEGEVEVVASEEFECSALTASLVLAQGGQVSKMTGESVATVELFEGTWSSGQRETYRFELEVPDGPASHSGDAFDFDWRVRVEADRTGFGAGSVEAEYPVRIDPAGPHSYDFGEVGLDGILDAQALSSWGAPQSCMTGGFALLFALMGLGLGAVGVLGTDMEMKIRVVVGACGLMLIALGAGLGNSLRWIRKLDAISLSPESSQYALGERLQCHVRCPPSAGLDPEQLRVVFRGTEWETGSKGGWVRRGTFHREEVELGEAMRSAGGGESRSVDVSFEIPDNASPSHVGTSQQIRWELGVETEARAGKTNPLWQTIVVVPPGRDPDAEW